MYPNGTIPGPRDDTSRSVSAPSRLEILLVRLGSIDDRLRSLGARVSEKGDQLLGSVPPQPTGMNAVKRSERLSKIEELDDVVTSIENALAAASDALVRIEREL